jgi:hypothetical protein
MIEYKELTQSVDVPAHSGVEGFLSAIRQVLRQPRVTRVEIDGNGKVSYTRFVRAEEPRKNVDFDFDSVSPGALVRNIEMQELDLFELKDNAAVCMAAMFFAADRDHMFPVGIVTGANTVFPDWHRRTTGVQLLSDNAYGLPVYRDRFIPDETLLLVTAFSRDASLVDARKSYKTAMPGREETIIPKQAVAIDVRIPQVTGGDPFILAEPPKATEVKVLP